MNKSVWNNTGDTVKLFNASNILQDSYAYTSDYDYCDLIPTSGEINDEIPSDPDGDCVNGSNIPSNKSYARIPNGTGSFVDPIPTPGKSNNVLEKNTEIIPVELVNIFSPIFDLSTPTATNGPSPTSIEEIEVVEPEIKISTSTQSLLDISSSVEVVEDTSAGQVEMILEETIIPETVVPEESTEIPTEPVAVEVIDIKSC